MPVIAKSDLFILVVSASLLAVGIYRWQHNMFLISANAQQAKVQRAVPASNATVISTIAASNAITQTSISAVTSVQTSIPVAVNNPSSISGVAGNNVSGSAADSVNAITFEDSEPAFGSYIVVPGDYLFKISQQYGTTVQSLQEINNIDGTLIEVGQKILFPLPAN
jgi:LysM repeat protein